jgi:hypothetical protein
MGILISFMVYGNMCMSLYVNNSLVFISVIGMYHKLVEGRGKKDILTKKKKSSIFMSSP